MASPRGAVVIRRLMQASAARPLLLPRIALRRSSSTAPATVVDTGFWKSLIPKPLRKESRLARAQGRSHEWNPATYFIVIFLLVGSMSIQMIVLRKQTDQYVRRSAVRIGLLREVVEKIRNGEEVDVAKVLGTGDAQREADWEEMLRAIERYEAMRKPSKRDEVKTRESRSQAEAATSEPQPSKPKTASLGTFF